MVFPRCRNVVVSVYTWILKVYWLAFKQERYQNPKTKLVPLWFPVDILINNVLGGARVDFAIKIALPIAMRQFTRQTADMTLFELQSPDTRVFCGWMRHPAQLWLGVTSYSQNPPLTPILDKFYFSSHACRTWGAGASPVQLRSN